MDAHSCVQEPFDQYIEQSRRLGPIRERSWFFRVSFDQVIEQSRVQFSKYVKGV